MVNKYCNLDGSKKIKDEFKKINVGFDKVEEDLKDIIVTPAKGVSEQEIIQARKGKGTLNERLNDTDSSINSTKDILNTRIDNIIATPTMVSEQEIIDARQGSVSLGANIAAHKEDYVQNIIPMRNQITNANFKNGVEGWGLAIGNATQILEDDTLIYMVDSPGHPMSTNLLNNNFTEGDKVYVNFKVTSNPGGNLDYYLRDAGGLRSNYSDISSLDDNQIINISDILTVTLGDPKRSLNFVIRIRTSSTKVDRNLTIYSGSVLTNLTEVFGRGNEPSIKEVEKMIQYVPNEWLEGNQAFGQKELLKIILELDKTSNPPTENTGNYYPNTQSRGGLIRSKPRFYAHRGFSYGAPENTLPAFELAAKTGFWGVEFDIVPTKDAEWVVHHGSDLSRYTEGMGSIGDINLNEVSNYTINKGVNIEMYPNLKIPTLEETLQLCNRHGLAPLIEIKNGGVSGIMERLIEVVVDNGFEEDAIIMSGTTNTLTTLRGLNENIALQLVRVVDITQEEIDILKGLGNTSITMHRSNLDEEKIAWFRREGIKVNVYSVNDFDEAMKFTNLGIDFITSDRLGWNYE